MSSIPLSALKSVLSRAPLMDWAPGYNKAVFGADFVAATIVTVMLIPQSLAYALLAGLPPEMGLYASILPLIAYAVFGTSRVLAVGPVAILSLMTATALSQLTLANPAQYAAAAIALALVSGIVLILMGVLRLGFLANFLSHPVISGFITASGLLIAVSQLKHILGIPVNGHALPEVLLSLVKHSGETNLTTLALGGSALAALFWSRTHLRPFLQRIGVPENMSGMLAKTGPVLAVVLTTLAVWRLDLTRFDVAIVGVVPTGLPLLAVPELSLDLGRQLLWPAVLISVIGFVESVSVAQTLAARNRQRINPNQELYGLGASNISAALSGGYPVTGGFSRSVVNFDAGARTPAAGAFAAVGITIVALFLTPFLHYLPKATLAATIIVAVLGLIDLTILRRAWQYSKADFAAVATTMLVTLVIGVEAGVSAGVALSLLLFLYKAARPHVAEVGLVPETEHFRNILRHKVETRPDFVTLRLDESLFFANARYLEEHIYDRVVGAPDISHVVLMCTAINEIDLSALESLEAINLRLAEMDIALHLSEVKGPISDRLKRSQFLEHLTGKVFLSQFDAWMYLTRR